LNSIQLILLMEKYVIILIIQKDLKNLI